MPLASWSAPSRRARTFATASWLGRVSRSRSCRRAPSSERAAFAGQRSSRRSGRISRSGSIRGNVDTRIRKVEEGQFDAVVLAAAGVRRLGLEQAVTEWLPEETMLPAPGQGALAVQCRADDDPMRALLSALDDPAARATTAAERAFLAGLGGGCAAPVAALALATATPRVRLQGLVASVDGREVVRVRGDGEPLEVGQRLAEEALSAGADRILAAIRD